MSGVDDQDWNAIARTAWQLLEPYHAVAYFAPEHREACDRAGLRGGWMAYFASRSAPLGPAPAGLVAALFYSFHPDQVARAIPDAWRLSDPDAILAARYEGVDAALRRMLAGDVGSEAVRHAADLARRAALAGDVAGHPMFAANLALDWPGPPHLVLWQATTLLREHRGDGHVATLVAAGVDACEAQVLQVATGRVPREHLQPYRGWSDAEWSGAADRLRARGWLDAGGALTAAGRDGLAGIDRRTDRLASAPLRRIGRDAAQELLTALDPVVRRILETGEMPFPNAIGVPRPEAPSGH